jgi:hypothetical protein
VARAEGLADDDVASSGIRSSATNAPRTKVRRRASRSARSRASNVEMPAHSAGSSISGPRGGRPFSLFDRKSSRVGRPARTMRQQDSGRGSVTARIVVDPSPAGSTPG